MSKTMFNPILFLKSALTNPPRVGSEGVQSRYARMQAVLIIWRLLTLAQIPVLAIICPACFLSTRYALFVFGVALAYTLLYLSLAGRPVGPHRHWLHAADQAAAAGMLLLAHESTLVYIIAFYTYASLFSGPVMTTPRIMVPVAGMSLVFLAAALRTPDYFYTDSILVSEFLVYWLWGLSMLGTIRIMNRVSALELDALLEEQRRAYRRQLHDDLGNTLCGLHFRIQSLRRSGSEELQRALTFLARGYSRAGDVLGRILSNINDLEDQGFSEALASTIRKTEVEFSVNVDLSPADREIGLSPEVQREVLAIVREAIANAAKHAGTRTVTVRVQRQRRRLLLSIADGGRGFDVDAPPDRLSEGGSGIRGMKERTRLINGKLQIVSNGAGTTVSLEVPERSSGNKKKDLSTDGGVYTFFAFLKMLVSLLVLLQFPLLEAPLRSNPVIWVIGNLLFFEGLAGFIWRHRLYPIVVKMPWILVAEQTIFSLLIYLSWREQLFLVLEYTPTAALLVSACFLGIGRNIALAAWQGALLSLAFVLLSTSTGTTPDTIEEVITSITSNLLIALFAGLIVEFIASLKSLQDETIGQALARQREQLTGEAHRELYTLIRSLGLDILDTRPVNPAGDGYLGKIESRSRELKQALRRIITAIDQQEESVPETRRAA